MFSSLCVVSVSTLAIFWPLSLPRFLYLRYDRKTDRWTPVVAMNSRRSGVGLSVVSGRLLVVGGFDGCTYLKSVEWFDQSINQWKQAANMNYRRLGCGVGVLRLTNTS